MKLLKILVFAALKFINLFFLPFKVQKNRIVFSSYFSREPEGNLKCVLNALQNEKDFETHTLFMKYGRDIKSKLQYFFNLLKEIYYFNTSRLIVLEGNSVVLGAIRKKKGVFALQLWHAAGAFKKFGQDTDRLYKIRGLNGAAVSSYKVAGIYAEALNIPKENIYVVGIPRLDPVFTPETAGNFADAIREKHPQLKNKKVLLYAPTFRGKGIDDICVKDVDLQKIAKDLPEGLITEPGG